MNVSYPTEIERYQNVLELKANIEIDQCITENDKTLRRLGENKKRAAQEQPF
jgi:hypothetical protein